MKITKATIWALTFSSMGFMLLLVMVIFERGAFNLLFNLNHESDTAVKGVFEALRLVIHVMPYTLGPFILGTMVFGWVQVHQLNYAKMPLVAMLIYTLAIVYNITLADTAQVVETLKNTTSSQSMTQIRYATQGVMRQHHVGLIGFGAFFITHLIWMTKPQ